MNNKYFKQLNIVEIETNRVWSYCPFPKHKDTQRPNLSISLIEPYYGRYKCWACGREGWLTEYQMNQLDLSKSKLKKKKYTTIYWNKLQQNYYDNYRPSIEGKRICGFWQVRGNYLSDLSIGWAGGQAYTFPFRNENNEIIGIQLRYPDGSKRCIEGSKLGLFIPQNIDWFEQDTIFITEGVSDLACLLDLGFVGIGRPSANSGEDLIIEWLKCNIKTTTRIHTIADNDPVGIDAARCLARRWNNVAKGYAYYTIPYEGKDFREWVQQEGKDKVKNILLDLIK